MKIILAGHSIGWAQALAEHYEDATDVQVITIDPSLNGQNEFAQVKEKDVVLFLYHDVEQQKKLIPQLKKAGATVILSTPVEWEANTNHPSIRKSAEQYELPLFDLNRYLFFLANEYSEDFQGSFVKEVVRYLTLRLREFLNPKPWFKKHYYGACMYPEVWSRDIFKHDVEHMASIGMNFARFGEFAWKTIEPEEGQFDLSLFEDALQIYQDNNIDVCLCIPTPTPPRWFTEKFPESKIKNIDGTVMEHGSRQHVCTNNPDFRRYAYRMTKKVASLVEKYPNIIAIQLDNEFKCHVDLCYCDACQTQWHSYVEEEYETIENVNHKWGTLVWSEHYDSFNSIVLPTRTPFLHNSSLMNAFRKFTADTLNEFAHDLCHYIRMETGIPITHNTAFGFNLMNDRLFQDLDVAGFDTYAPYSNYPAFTLNVDRWRNVKDTNNEMMLLETSTSHAGHIENYIPPAPAGWITAEMFIGFAGNLKAFSYWHYRSHHFGVEQPHSAVVTAWGEPDIGYEDVVKSGELAEKMQPFLQESDYQKAKIAFMYSDHAKRFYNVENGGSYDHRTLATEYYGTLIRNGINVEVIHESSPYDDYDVLIVPFVRWINETVLGKMKAFVERGGKLILGPMTGDRTEELTWPERNGLDRIGEWLEFKNIRQFTVKGIDYTARYQNETEKMDRLITTIGFPETWESMMTNEQATLAAKGKVGNGEVVYVGGLPENMTTSNMWQTFIEKEIVPFETDQAYLKVTDGLKKYTRTTADTKQVYVVNMTTEPAGYELYQDANELLTDKSIVAGTVGLDAYEYHILSFAK